MSMLVFINAFKSIIRSKGRNILIGIIAFTIAVASCVALSIQNAANEAEASGMEQTHITATISVNRQKMMEEAAGQMDPGNGGKPDIGGMREMLQQNAGLSLSEMQTYAASQYVSDFYYSGSVSLSASGELEPVSTEDSSDDSDTQANENAPGGGRGDRMPGGFGGVSMGDFTVTGYSSENAMTSFLNGSAQITDGSIFDIESAELSCLISNELALFNGLSVGDSITLANPNNEEETYAVTIAGIYTSTESADTGMGMRFFAAMDPANAIYLSYPALQSIIDQSAASATTTTDDNGNETSSALVSQVSGVYELAGKEDYDAFCEDVYTLGLSENYSVSSTDVSSYEASLIPLQNLSKFAGTLLLIVLIVGGIILIVINIFNIRERKYEVGVLTAIGIKKGKVALQFVVELLAVTLASILIGAGVGSAVSVPVANSLLESQITAQEQQLEQRQQSFGRGGADKMPPDQQGSGFAAFGKGQAANVTYLDQINAATNLTVLFQLIGIGVILTILSSLAGVIFVLRYEPLKILSNRS